MYKRQNLVKSFLNAARGFVKTVKEERNMRMALCFVPPVISYGFFAELNAAEFAVVIICIFAVFIAESLNSSIENVIDMTVKEYNELAGKAKDMAAAATLLASVMSVIAGGSVLYKPQKLAAVAEMFKNPLFLAAVVFYIILCCIFSFTAGRK